MAMPLLLTFCLSWCSLRSSRSPTDLCVARSVFSAESIQSSKRPTSSSNLINSSLHSCSCLWRDSLSWYTCRIENPRYFYRPQTKFAKVMFSQVSVHRGEVWPIACWADTPPPGQTPPLRSACWVRSTSGQYASHWNAFLLC